MRCSKDDRVMAAPPTRCQLSTIDARSGQFDSAFWSRGALDPIVALFASYPGLEIDRRVIEHNMRLTLRSASEPVKLSQGTEPGGM